MNDSLEASHCHLSLPLSLHFCPFSPSVTKTIVVFTPQLKAEHCRPPSTCAFTRSSYCDSQQRHWQQLAKYVYIKKKKKTLLRHLCDIDLHVYVDVSLLYLLDVEFSSANKKKKDHHIKCC